MEILKILGAGFSMAGPASKRRLDEIASGTLVHFSRKAYLDSVIAGIYRNGPDRAKCRIRLSGDRGTGMGEMLRTTMRDYRIIDFNLFQGAAGRRFHDFVYFFLGEPAQWQVGSQNFGGSGEFATIRVKGTDALADPRRRFFYRRGLFWEGDRVVIIKGGYEGLAEVEGMPINLKAPFI
ncbi:hypothetical protein ABMY26_23455 [Azospirillum sp. HJ39]|uniref:hypothetical protein n=1 Tax=Azospirillum sp. HJ39 TaxID=3159496 RepID=UPI003557DE68